MGWGRGPCLDRRAQSSGVYVRGARRMEQGGATISYAPAVAILDTWGLLKTLA